MIWLILFKKRNQFGTMLIIDGQGKTNASEVRARNKGPSCPEIVRFEI